MSAGPGPQGAPPNILYIHSHDTGRYVQPYGFAVPTPNIQLLADQGVLFREAFCAMPTCSGSRACLLTGQGGVGNGMLGLAHRGWRLRDYGHHLVHTLRGAGYHSALIGEQHISDDPDAIGFDEVVELETHNASEIAPSAIATLRRLRGREPFFCSVGFFETHRNFAAPVSVRDTLYSLPPPNLPDTPRTRQDMAAFKASARSLDQGIGAVLNALHTLDLVESTLIICTTDHGLAFPGAKATLYDRGTGVLLIMRGPGGFAGGKVIDAMVSHLDVYPTICELAGIEPPPWLEGSSMMPLVRGERAADPRRDLHRDDLPRRLPAPARDPHRALEVHPPVRGRPAPRARQLRRQRRARTCWSSTAGRGAARRRRGALRPRLRPERGSQRGRRARERGRARRASRPARASGWSSAATRCSTGPVAAAARRRGQRPRSDLAGRADDTVPLRADPTAAPSR